MERAALSKGIATVGLEDIDPREFRDLQMKDPQWKTVIEFLVGGDLSKHNLSAPVHEF